MALKRGTPSTECQTTIEGVGNMSLVSITTLKRFAEDRVAFACVRWMAMFTLRMELRKYWRSSRTNAISKEEKAQIKARLFLPH